MRGEGWGVGQFYCWCYWCASFFLFFFALVVLVVVLAVRGVKDSPPSPPPSQVHALFGFFMAHLGSALPRLAEIFVGILPAHALALFAAQYIYVKKKTRKIK